MRGLILFLLSACFISSQSGLQAGGRDDLLFDVNGKRVFGEPSSEVIQIFPKLATTCGSDSPCVSWKLIVESTNDESLVLEQVNSAISIWSESELTDLEFSYAGASSDSEIPYVLDGSNRALDSYGNEIIEGDFFISLNPPTDILQSLRDTGSYTQSVQYVVPNLDTAEGEIFWAGIFVNPDFLSSPYGSCSGNDCIKLSGQSSLSLKSILAFSIGQSFLGLSSSGIRSSVMYPIQKYGDGRVFSSASVDDLAWLNFLYPSGLENSFGEIQGVLKDGLDGSFLEGGHVTAVSSDILTAINSGEEVNFGSYIVSGSVVQKAGKFRIRIPAGDYLLFVESLDGNALRPDFFSEWMRYFGSNKTFPQEFYEGKDRESNLEAWDSSLATIVLSARISVFESETSDNVVFFTNEPSATQSFFAPGAANETLSEITLADLEQALREAENRDQNSIGTRAAGCQIGGDTTHSSVGLSFAALLVILFASLLFHRTIFRS